MYRAIGVGGGEKLAMMKFAGESKIARLQRKIRSEVIEGSGSM